MTDADIKNIAKKIEVIAMGILVETIGSTGYDGLFSPPLIE
jgi:hypothetical protein